MRDDKGRFVKGAPSEKIKWTPEALKLELTNINERYGQLTEATLQDCHRSSCAQALARYYGSFNKGLKELGFQISRRHDHDNKLRVPTYSELSPSKASVLAWITETSIYQTNCGAWLVQLESPEKELNQLLRQDIKETYRYWGRSWDEYKPTSRNTYKTRACSKSIVEDIAYFATWGTEHWGLTQNYFQHPNRSEETDASFIQRFFDCEGSVALDKKTRTIHIAATSLNHTGLIMISNMLSALKIDNTTYPDRTYLKVRVNKKAAIKRFAQIINFGLSRKRERLATLMSECHIVKEGEHGN